MPAYNFKSYLTNLNRVRFIELIDDCHAEIKMQSFRASLIVNPVTGLAYDAPAATSVHAAGA